MFIFISLQISFIRSLHIVSDLHIVLLGVLRPHLLPELHLHFDAVLLDEAAENVLHDHRLTSSGTGSGRSKPFVLDGILQIALQRLFSLAACTP